MSATATPMKNTGTLKVTTPTDREIAMTRVFDAPRRLVWEAWTSPEHLPHWMLGPSGWTMPVCEIDLRPGGAWHIVWRRSDGTEMGMRGVYREITPPERLVSTESWGGGLARNDQHADPLREGWQDDGHEHGSLPIEGSSRRRAQDGDEGRHIRELRPPRRVPANDGVRLDDQVVEMAASVQRVVSPAWVGGDQEDDAPGRGPRLEGQRMKPRGMSITLVLTRLTSSSAFAEEIK